MFKADTLAIPNEALLWGAKAATADALMRMAAVMSFMLIIISWLLD